jgi:hypothetical protein
MKKIMMVKGKKKNPFKTSISKHIEMQDLHESFFNSNIFLIILIILCVYILEKNPE